MERPCRILIAEDEFIIATDIAKILERLSYKVIGTCRNGKEVVDKAVELKPDLILMDVMLEGKTSGIEAAEEIMSSNDIPVIYLTAFADSATLEKAKLTEPFGYILKPFDSRTLHTSIEMALYKHEINKKLKSRTEELKAEQEKSELLLQNILPLPIILELKEKGIIQPRNYDSVTILFTDFEGFTQIASSMPPEELVSELNDIFKNFDIVIQEHGLEKLKTIGDSYMVGGGFPVENEFHAINVVKAAIEMQNIIKERSNYSKYPWKMRAGIHSGKIVAGVVGKFKYSYDVWGDTVHLANNMQRQGLPGMINITKTTYNLIKEEFECEFRGTAEFVGNGLTDMYSVICHKSPNKNINFNSLTFPAKLT
jgi:class 3 adenylate cyclase